MKALYTTLIIAVTLLSSTCGAFLINHGITRLYNEMTASLEWDRKLSEAISMNADEIWMNSWLIIFGLAFIVSGVYAGYKMLRKTITMTFA